MDNFEIAVLRVLVKRHVPLKLSVLVNGFPDNSEDHVLAAVSRLRKLGLVELSSYSLAGTACIVASKRREILKIVESSLSVTSSHGTVQRQVAPSASQILVSPSSVRRIIGSKRAIAPIALAVLLCGILAVGGAPSATSPNLHLVAYHHNPGSFEQVGGYSDDNVYQTMGYSHRVVIEVVGDGTTVVTYEAYVVQPHQPVLS